MERRTGRWGVERQGLGGMKTGIMTGTVFHKRYSPVEHEFRYKHGMLLVDIGELDGFVLNLALYRSSDLIGWLFFGRTTCLRLEPSETR